MTATVEAAHAGQRLLDLADRLCPDKDDEGARQDAAAIWASCSPKPYGCSQERHTAARHGRTASLGRPSPPAN